MGVFIWPTEAQYQEAKQTIHSFIYWKRKDLKPAINTTELHEQDNEHNSNAVTQKEYKYN